MTTKQQTHNEITYKQNLEIRIRKTKMHKYHHNGEHEYHN